KIISLIQLDDLGNRTEKNLRVFRVIPVPLGDSPSQLFRTRSNISLALNCTPGFNVVTTVDSLPNSSDPCVDGTYSRTLTLSGPDRNLVIEVAQNVLGHIESY